MTESTVIAHTANWIQSVVIGLNFCPFAAKSVLKKSLRYVVVPNATLDNSLEAVLNELHFLDASEDIETTLIIFPDAFADFEHDPRSGGSGRCTGCRSGLRWRVPDRQFSPRLLF